MLFFRNNLESKDSKFQNINIEYILFILFSIRGLSYI